MMNTDDEQGNEYADPDIVSPDQVAGLFPDRLPVVSQEKTDLDPYEVPNAGAYQAKKKYFEQMSSRVMPDTSEMTDLIPGRNRLARTTK